METKEVLKRGRGRPRKHKRDDERNDNVEKVIFNVVKRQAVDVRMKPLVGRYVLKEFVGSGLFLGKIVSYDSGFYRVDYEDGDCEDLEGCELKEIILDDDNGNAGDYSQRKKRLDELLLSKSTTHRTQVSEKVRNRVKYVDATQRSPPSGLVDMPAVKNMDARARDNADYSSDSCGDVLFQQEPEVPKVPPPLLPPSSGTIGVPEEYVVHLFSVYSFLRSFNFRLFLSPFSLNDFVGAINCQVKNALLDSVHVALMHALKSHLEMVSQDGSEIATRCLGCVDWSLLDSMTWPVYLTYYLNIMGYVRGLEWKGFNDDLSNMEYYSLSVGRKLITLQILCDDVLESAELRAEIDIREESEAGKDVDVTTSASIENGSQMARLNYSEASACKNMEDTYRITRSHQVMCCSSPKSSGLRSMVEDSYAGNVGDDGNVDECRLCGMDGTLICCDSCPSAYHCRCIGITRSQVPDGPWYCSECTINSLAPLGFSGTSLKGAKVFGIDAYEQVFLGTSNHLLVMRYSINKDPCFRYYNHVDIPNVLQVLYFTMQHRSLYYDILKEIVEYWHIRSINLSLLEMEGGLNQSFVGNLEPNHGVNVSRNDEIRSENALLSVEHNTVDPGSSVDLEQDPFVLTLHKSFATCRVIDFGTTNNGVIFEANMPLQSNVRREADFGVDGFSRHKFFGANFKHNGYVNQYLHGDVAASAAANLSLLSTDDHKLGNTKKVSSDVVLQAKAFSAAAFRFFWPTHDKKLMEVPKERCGWCYTCKNPPTNRRGCMLNSAFVAATKCAAKFFISLCPPVSKDESLYSISLYLLYMEKMLRGLTGGPFLTERGREQWSKRVLHAPSGGVLKSSLLELEENIFSIAISGDWVKAANDWLVESPLIQSAPSTSGTSQKRGPHGRRYKRQSTVSDIAEVSIQRIGFVWWRGGKLSKLVSHQAILPHHLVYKAARQGGLRKIFGIHYMDETIIPKVSRQMAWRAEVERSKTASQLALQVRCLDFHIRWGDLVRPEQNFQDVKCPDGDTSVFRNAIVCGKKMEESRVKYGIVFHGQKQLPSRVLRNVVGEEQLENGKYKIWFFDVNVPLYLIKDYETAAARVALPLAKMPSCQLSELQKKQLKASRSDVFLYLACKRDGVDKCSCASCHCDVLLRNSVKCNVCQGYCHDECIISSMIYRDQDVDFLMMCKQCYNGKGVYHDENSNNSPTSPLPLDRRESSGTASRAKSTVIKLPKAKQSSGILKERKRRLCNWGVIWKKKNAEETGVDFRSRNILARGSSDGSWLSPVCKLCAMPYDSNLTYIHCEVCHNWFHAEAVQLEDSRLAEVVGFKCCRCRRIRPPICPYQGDADQEKSQPSKLRLMPSSSTRNDVEDQGAILDSGLVSQYQELEPNDHLFPDCYSEDGSLLLEDDSLLFSLSKVGPIRELDSQFDFEWNINYAGNHGGEMEMEMGSEQKKPSPHFHGDYANHRLELTQEVDFDSRDGSYEEMQFEPQTYFSFTELLASDLGNHHVEEVRTLGNQNEKLPLTTSSGKSISPKTIDSLLPPKA